MNPTILHVPDAHEIIRADERIRNATAAAQVAGTAEAKARCRVIAHLIRRVLPDAATLVFDKDVNDDDHTDITPLLIRDADGELLWFCPAHAYDHADAEELADSGKPRYGLHHEFLRNIRYELADAYDADDGHFAISDEEVYGYDNLLELHIDAAIAADQPPAGRKVTAEGPNGVRHEFYVAGDDDTFYLSVDDMPLVGVTKDGAGWWPDPDGTWERLVPGGEATERTVSIEGITTEEMWRDLEKALGLPLYALGRWKEWAAGEPTHLRDIYDLEAAVDWARRHGLTYEDERTLRYEATPTEPTAGTHDN